MRETMLDNILAAIGLMLVFEGILPFVNPERLRKLLRLLMDKDDKTLRILGLSMMVVGVLIVVIVHAGLLD